MSLSFIYNLGGDIPSWNTIKKRIENLWSTSSLQIKPIVGLIQSKCQKMLKECMTLYCRVPKSSSRKQSDTLRVFNTSIHQNLFLDLNVHPYMTAVVQKLDDRYLRTDLILCQRLLKIVNEENLLQVLIIRWSSFWIVRESKETKLSVIVYRKPKTKLSTTSSQWKSDSLLRSYEVRNNWIILIFRWQETLLLLLIQLVMC